MQTSAKSQISTKSDPGFEFGFVDKSELGCLPDNSRFINLSASFVECPENRPVTVREMLINLKFPILQWWEKWKSHPKSVSGTESVPKVNQFLRLEASPNHNAKFQWNRLITFAVILQNRQNEWRNKRQIIRTERSLGGGNKGCHVY